MNRGTAITTALPVPSAYFTPPTTLCGVGDMEEERFKAQQDNRRQALQLLSEESRARRETELEVWRAERDDAKEARAIDRQTELQRSVLDASEKASERAGDQASRLAAAGTSAQSRLLKGLVVVAGLGFLLYGILRKSKKAPEPQEDFS